MYEIINLRGATKASGVALIGARRARIVANPDVKRASAGGGGLAAGAWKTGLAAQVIVEVEGIDEVVNAIRGDLVAITLTLHYVGPAGPRQRVCKYCTATAVGESRFPPAEGSGHTPLSQITFDLHAGSGVETPAEALVDSSFGGTPPAGTMQPTVRLLAAARGAAGNTPIASAVEATLRCGLTKTVGRRNAYGLPQGVWVTAQAPRVAITLEDASAWLASLVGAVEDEILHLTFQAGANERTLTCRYARQVEFGDEAYKAAEEAGPPARPQLLFDIVAGGTVASVRDALVMA